MMTLREMRPLRAGTRRFTVSGVDGMDTAAGDRVTCSIWPADDGVRVMVVISGSLNEVADCEMPGFDGPSDMDRDTLSGVVWHLISDIEARRRERKTA